MNHVFILTSFDIFFFYLAHTPVSISMLAMKLQPVLVHLCLRPADLKSIPLSPCMIYIHGGYSNFGSNGKNFYNPQFLLRKQIVFISINFDRQRSQSILYLLIPYRVDFTWQSVRISSTSIDLIAK